MRSRRWQIGPALAGCVGVLATGGCSDDVAAPAPPAFRIMIDLPTIRLVTIEGERYVALDVFVTRGIVEAAVADRFFLHTTLTFMDEDLPADGVIVVSECPVADLTKDQTLRRGELAEVTALVPLTAAVWDALLAADGGEGDKIGVSAVIELVLRDAAGGSRVLHQVTAASELDID